ncbi:MAG: alpha-D-ribose 1-methylphosphonate 5-triphosphate diphosphatase [Pseudomonadota bacterium]
MTQDTIITNAKIVLTDEVISGTVVLRDGHIIAVDQDSTTVADVIDAGGDFLAPGLVELHTDNLERHMSPRPKVDWPHHAAILAHDRELASTGITTVFDAIRVGSILSDGSYRKYARQMADEILAMRDAGTLRISHHIHLRAEVCSETLLDELEEFGPEDRVGIVSLMDHTPGQRQFTDIEKYKAYICGKRGLSTEEFDKYVTFLGGLQKQNGAKHEAATVAAAKRYGATLASHDDTTPEHVTHSHTNGVTLAEFPTTHAAADACHSHGISTIMGAPNIVRGGSHSGNVAALDLAKANRLDILSSDYVPASLLMAAVTLGDLWGNMARGLATVTRNPARAVGLTDQGEIAPGQRADLIQFNAKNGIPALNRTWSAGHRVA